MRPGLIRNTDMLLADRETSVELKQKQRRERLLIQAGSGFELRDKAVPIHFHNFLNHLAAQCIGEKQRLVFPVFSQEAAERIGAFFSRGRFTANLEQHAVRIAEGIGKQLIHYLLQVVVVEIKSSPADLCFAAERCDSDVCIVRFRKKVQECILYNHARV